jgi:2-isopropylmalate synthase
MEAARDVSTMVNAYSRSNYSERAPIVGVNAFTHSADLHIKAFARNLNAYCWLPNYPDQKVQISERIALETYVNHSPKVISSTELKYHGKGPGSRYLMLDERVAPNVKQYCIVREIDEYCEDYPSYVDEHTHNCDSLFLFLGDEPAKKGLQVMVRMEDAEFILDSPASVFIPAGKQHTYKVLKGKGSFVNHVLHQNYNLSLLEPEEVKASSMHSVTNS